MAEPAWADRGSQRVRAGLFEIDLTCSELYKSGRKVALQEQPFRVLAMLVERNGELVTRQELQTRLWPADTYVGFEEGLNTAIRKLRLAFGDSADNPRFIETVPRRGYRFIAPVSRQTNGANGGVDKPLTASELRTDLEFLSASPAVKAKNGKSWGALQWRWLAAVGICAVLTLAGMYWRSRNVVKFADGDYIVFANFANSTGDPIFDDTMQTVLSFYMGESPFLIGLSRQKLVRALKEMNRPATEPVTEDIAREVCRRTGSKATFQGSIAGLGGGGYKISVKAMNCDTGAVLARSEREASDKTAVIRTLFLATVDVRREMGESTVSLQRYEAASVQTVLPSLEALKEDLLGQRAERQKGNTAALPFYKRAVELDPGFAFAYLHLSSTYHNLNEAGLAEENARKAFELRDRVSVGQRLAIEANYYENVTGELDKDTQVLALQQQNNPLDASIRGNLGAAFSALGNHEKALEQMQAALRLEPNYGAIYMNVANEDQNLNRFGEAEAAYKQAQEHGLSNELMLQNRYLLAFSEGDAAQMEELAASAMGKPGTEDLLLSSQADTEAWYGKLKNARALTERAMDSARHNDAVETAAVYQVAAALREVEAGDGAQARTDAKAALKLTQDHDVRTVAALALARGGDTAAAEKLAAELDKQFPLATLIQKYWLPTIRAAIALDRNDPNRAVDLLKVAIPLELSTADRVPVYLCPAYVRGDAYLTLHDGKAAAAEFQKYVDNRGLLANFPWGALAQLGLARAYALDAENGPAARDKARKAYEDFLALWKDADPDVPVLRQAKVEYGKLHSPH